MSSACVGPLALLIAILSSCGDVEVGEGDPGADLHLTQTFEGSGTYVEGVKSYFELRSGDDTVLKRELANDRLDVRVEPGPYVLASYQRACAGECSQLDPPSSQCERRGRFGNGDRIKIAIVVHPGGRGSCAIHIHPLEPH
jgi:hypothetical protein